MKALQFGCIVVAMTIVGINRDRRDAAKDAQRRAGACGEPGTFHHRAAERSVVRRAAHDALSDIRFS